MGLITDGLCACVLVYKRPTWRTGGGIKYFVTEQTPSSFLSIHPAVILLFFFFFSQALPRFFFYPYSAANKWYQSS
jgi:hypothetical protein